MPAVVASTYGAPSPAVVPAPASGLSVLGTFGAPSRTVAPALASWAYSPTFGLPSTAQATAPATTTTVAAVFGTPPATRATPPAGGLTTSAVVGMPSRTRAPAWASWFGAAGVIYGTFGDDITPIVPAWVGSVPVAGTFGLPSSVRAVSPQIPTVLDLAYHLYGNVGTGGPVDYATPLATVTVPTWTTFPLFPSSDYTFAVRAFDASTGYEERNVTARVRIVTGPAGEDLTAMPHTAPPFSVKPTSGTTAAVKFKPFPEPLGAPPTTEYRAYVGTPAVSYTSPAGTIPWVANQPFYTIPLAGLTPGTVYQCVLRAANAVGAEANTRAVSFTTPASAPGAPVSGGYTVGPPGRPGVPPVFP